METQSTGIGRESQFKSQGAFLGNGQPRTLDFVGLNPGQESAQSGMMLPPYQPGMFPPPISEFTSAQLPLARLAEKSDSVMAHGKYNRNFRKKKVHFMNLKCFVEIKFHSVSCTFFLCLFCKGGVVF